MTIVFRLYLAFIRTIINFQTYKKSIQQHISTLTKFLLNKLQYTVNNTASNVFNFHYIKLWFVPQNVSNDKSIYIPPYSFKNEKYVELPRLLHCLNFLL